MAKRKPHPSLPVVTTLAEDIEHLRICLKCIETAVAEETELDGLVSQLQYNVGLFWRKWRTL
jgi:hypothetical protein